MGESLDPTQLATEPAAPATDPTPRSRNRLIAVVVLIACLGTAVGVNELWPRHRQPAEALVIQDAAQPTLPDRSGADRAQPGPTASKPKPKPKPAATHTPAPGEPGWRNQSPPSGSYTSYVSIPAQGVIAPMEGPCVRRDGGIEPASYDPRVTCIWDRGAQLGADQGEATILGHINYNGINGSLGRIGQLHIGDSIYTFDATGKRTAWKVSNIVQRPKAMGVDPTAEMGPYGPKRLVLVTCGGAWVGGADGYADLIWLHAVPA